MPIKITMKYVNAPDSQQRVMRVYGRLIEIAKQNIIERRKLEAQQEGGEEA